MSRAPEVVFIDERVAATMPDQDPDDRLTAYVRQDVYEKAVRSTRATEKLAQLIPSPEGHLLGLSTWGRVWALIGDEDDPEKLPGWELVEEGLLAVELDS